MSTPYKKTIRYLSQVQDIDNMINEKQDLINSLHTSITKMSLQLDNERVQTSVKDRLSETCVKIVDLFEQLNRDIDVFVDTKAEVIQKIDQYVDDLKERRLLYLRYLKYIPVTFIAVEMGISERSVYRLHTDAINNLSKMWSLADDGSKWQGLAVNGSKLQLIGRRKRDIV